MDLVDWVEKRCEPVEGGRQFFEDTVAKNLRLGRFLTLIVGDRIRQSLIEMLNYVNRYPHLAMDVGLVEMQCYRWTNESSWPLLVVPSIVARTEVVERSVVQITIKKDGDHQIDVRQEKAEPKGHKKVTLTEESFWEILQHESPDSFEKVKALIEEYRNREGIVAEPTEGSIVIRLDIQDTGYRASTFYVTKTGLLGVWPVTIGDQLEKAGLDRRLAEDYGNRIKDLIKMPGQNVLYSRKIQEVNIETFKSIVDQFIESLRDAKPLNS